MRFLNPDVLWHLLWLMPLMIVVFVVSGHKTAAALKSFLGKHAEDPEYVQVSKGKRLLRFVILLLSVVFLVGAAARPSWGVQIQEIHGKQVDTVRHAGKMGLCQQTQKTGGFLRDFIRHNKFPAGVLGVRPETFQCIE